MVGEIFPALSSLKTMFDIAISIRDIDNATQRNAAVIELQRAIFETQEQLMELLKQNQQLSSQVESYKDWEREKNRYRLTRFQTGALAYTLKEEASDDEPWHCLCPTCFTEGKKSLLLEYSASGGNHFLICRKCETRLKIRQAEIGK